MLTYVVDMWDDYFMVKEINIYTDGSCYPNPGPAGIAFVCPELDMAINAPVEKASNNQAELMAIGFAFSKVLERIDSTHDTDEYHVTVHTDSEYCVRELSRRNPREGKPNYQLICSIRQISRGFNSVRYRHVRGHAGNPFNEHCDHGANEARLYGIEQRKSK